LGLFKAKKQTIPDTSGRLGCIFFNKEKVQKKQVYGSVIIQFGINSKFEISSIGAVLW